MSSKIDGLRFEGDDEADSLDQFFEDPAPGSTATCVRCGLGIRWPGDGWMAPGFNSPYACDRNPARDGHEPMTSTLKGPILPYAGTSGWSGSDASRERAEERDISGKTIRTQYAVLNYVSASDSAGATIKDIRAAFPGQHHGTLSGALTALHKGGRLARLTEKRDRCSIYVLPEYVNGREVAQPGTRSSSPDLITMLTDEQERRCAYGTREGDGRTCDCKYASPIWPSTSETTGCPELRAAIWTLRGRR